MNIAARVKGLIVDPNAEWRAIAGERTSFSLLILRYVAILAAIPAVCGLIGSVLLGSQIVPSLLFAIVSYLLMFLAVYAEAFLIDVLAPMFKAQRSFSSAVKIAAYFPTAYWLTAIFFAVPVLSVLALLGLYSLYLLWIGLPILMRVPAEQAVAYTASAGVGAIIVAAVCLTIAARVSGVAIWVF